MLLEAAPTSTLDYPEPPPYIPTLAQIKRAEAVLALNPAPMPEAVHHFAQGMYARELTIPAGHYITGKTHRKEHIFIVLTGDLTVWTEHGMMRAGPGFMVTGQPGTKRIAYAHTDTRCVAISENPTNTRDLDQLEAEIIQPDAALEALVCSPLEIPL
ncbi:MAG: hypothetical protein V4641_01940 [Pseudomonadota bacterium]